jgi:chromosome partitioning protein
MINERGLPIFAGEIHRLVAFQKAALAGTLVREVNDARAARGWDEYVAVGEEIVSEQIQ